MLENPHGYWIPEVAFTVETAKASIINEWV